MYRYIQYEDIIHICNVEHYCNLTQSRFNFLHKVPINSSLKTANFVTIFLIKPWIIILTKFTQKASRNLVSKNGSGNYDRVIQNLFHGQFAIGTAHSAMWKQFYMLYNIELYLVSLRLVNLLQSEKKWVKPRRMMTSCLSIFRWVFKLSFLFITICHTIWKIMDLILEKWKHFNRYQRETNAVHERETITKEHLKNKNKK